MVPSLHAFLSTAFGYATPQESFIPIYDQSVSPINALAWAMPVAMASAIALYSVLKRKAMGGNFALIMSFLAVAFIFLGYLSAAVKAGGFQGAMYPAFAFLIPSAAALGVRLLKSSKMLAVILLVSVVICAGIASTDPTLSSERYRRTGAGDIDTKVGDYITAVFLTDRIPPSRCLFMPYEIASSFEYLTVATNASPHPRYTSSADIERIEVDRVVTDKELLPDMIYIWPERWLPNVNSHLDNSSVNIYFDSTRHVVFERSRGDR